MTSGERTNEQSECVGKRRFDGRISARDAARKVSGKGAGRFHAYRCTFCAGWHIAGPGRI